MPRVPPPEVVSAWPAQNLTDPERRGPAKTVVTVVLWALVAAVLSLRLYTRRYISKHLGWDDILAVVAFVPATAFSIVGIVAEYEFGWDRHIWDLPEEWVTKGLQLRYVAPLSSLSRERDHRLRHFTHTGSRALPSSSSQRPPQSFRSSPLPTA